MASVQVSSLPEPRQLATSQYRISFICYLEDLPVALGLLLEGQLCELAVLGCARGEDIQHVYTG